LELQCKRVSHSSTNIGGENMIKGFLRMALSRSKHRSAAADRQGGAALILATVSLGILLALGGLAVDAGRLFVTKTELQSAMDACALAAAKKINPGNTNSYYLSAAEAAGRAMSDPNLASLSAGGLRPLTSVNRAYFQGRTIDPTSVAVKFSPNLAGPFLTIGGGAIPNTAKFVQCTYDMTGIPVFLVRALAAAPGGSISIAETTTVASSAVAARAGGSGNPTGPGVCGVVPIAVCMTPGGTPANNFGFTRGQRLPAPCASGAPSCPNPGPGNFGWADLSPPAGGASELSGLISGGGACGTVAIGQDIGETGINASVHTAWNSRFGIYSAGGGLDINSAPPDYTGYSYNPNTPVVGGSYDTDYATRVASSAVFNQAGAGFANNAFGGGVTMLTSVQYRTYGSSRRLVVAPVVDCSEYATGPGLADVRGLACMFLLAPYPVAGPTGTFLQRVEYLGLAGDVNSPCILSGAPGSGGGGGGSIATTVPFLVR
jgi:Putative Flp pilus-assembly TadE/G-like